MQTTQLNHTSSAVSTIHVVNSDDEPITKIGTCPSNPLSNPGCITECRTDTDCAGIKKCCTFGCGRQCQMPQSTTGTLVLLVWPIKGASSPVLACIHWKDALEALAKNDTTAFIPKCGDQGDFAPVQCHAKLGQCWCVDRKTGIEILGTRTPAKEPNCTSRCSTSQKLM